MSHSGLIGGASYNITGGKTLIGGTGYDIAQGKTLIGGASYDIPFTWNGVVFENGRLLHGTGTHVIAESSQTSGVYSKGVGGIYINGSGYMTIDITGFGAVYNASGVITGYSQIGTTLNKVANIDMTNYTTLHFIEQHNSTNIYGKVYILGDSSHYVTAPTGNVDNPVELTLDIRAYTGEQTIVYSYYQSYMGSLGTSYISKMWLT